MRYLLIALIASCSFYAVEAQSTFNGIDVNMGNLYRLSNAKSRSISPENFTGEKGKGGMANGREQAQCLQQRPWTGMESKSQCKD